MNKTNNFPNCNLKFFKIKFKIVKLIKYKEMSHRILMLMICFRNLIAETYNLCFV